MKKKRIVSLSLIVALIAIIAGGTYAYFTDNTGTATNTFTVGNVELSLTETKLKADGTPDEANKTIDDDFKGNEYKLIPGKEYTKDPKFHLGATSEPAWVFAEVKLGLNKVEKKDGYLIKDQMKDLGWTEIATKIDGNDIPTVLMRHKDVQKAGNAPLLFGKLQIDSDLDSKLEGGKYVLTNKDGETVFHSDITIKGFAIQSEGINDVTEVDEIAKAHFDFK